MTSEDAGATDQLTFTEEAAVNWLVRQVTPDCLRLLGYDDAAEFLEGMPNPEIGRRAPSGAAKTIREVREDLESTGRTNRLLREILVLSGGRSPLDYIRDAVPHLISLGNFARNTGVWPTATWEAYYIFHRTLNFLAVEHGIDSEQWAEAIDQFESAAYIEADEPLNIYIDLSQE